MPGRAAACLVTCLPAASLSQVATFGRSATASRLSAETVQLRQPGAATAVLLVSGVVAACPFNPDSFKDLLTS